jgi:hypothetical protein
VEIDAMLCDHGQVAGGKLFVSGGGIDTMHVPPHSRPPYVANFAVAGLVRVPWTATNENHTLTFKFVTEDGGHAPLPPEADPGSNGVSGEMRFNVGRPPQLASGQEQVVPFAFNFEGLPLMEAGRFLLVLELDGSEARRLNFTVALEPSPGFQGKPYS